MCRLSFAKLIVLVPGFRLNILELNQALYGTQNEGSRQGNISVKDICGEEMSTDGNEVIC